MPALPTSPDCTRLALVTHHTTPPASPRTDLPYRAVPNCTGQNPARPCLPCRAGQQREMPQHAEHLPTTTCRASPALPFSNAHRSTKKSNASPGLNRHRYACLALPEPDTPLPLSAKLSLAARRHACLARDAPNSEVPDRAFHEQPVLSCRAKTMHCSPGTAPHHTTSPRLPCPRHASPFTAIPDKEQPSRACLAPLSLAKPCQTLPC